jgi:hypothetical protein
MSDSGPRRSPTHAAGIADPLTGKSFQDQLALSRFAPGETVGLGPPMIAVTVPAWWRDERRQALQPLPVISGKPESVEALS